MKQKVFSVILPIYKNEENLPVTVPYILERRNLFPDYRLELVMVCDGSPDQSFEVMKRFQKQYPDCIKIASFMKNCGQRAAVNCGMQMASGDVMGVISADLQDPFELFVQMLKEWENGEKLVIGFREKREEKNAGSLMSRLLHKYIRKHINPEYPAGGFDFFLADRQVAEAFVKSDSRNNSMQLLLLDLVGHPKFIGYTRHAREIGTSGWVLKRKMDQVINIFSTYAILPFQMFFKAAAVCGVLGVILLILSLVLIAGKPAAAILAAVYSAGLFACCVILGVGSVIGSYLFKTGQNNQKGLRFVIDEMIDETGNRRE